MTGTAVRPTFRKAKHPELDDLGLYWTDDAGKPIGYVRPGIAPQGRTHKRQGTYTKSHISVDDHAGEPEQVIRVIAKIARERNLDQVWFIRMGYRSPMATFLRQRETLRMMQTTVRYMVKVLNLSGMLEAMTDELQSRVDQSLLVGQSATLALCYEDQQATIQVSDGKVSILSDMVGKNVIRGDHAVAKLLVGGEEPSDILKLSSASATWQACAIAQVLLPNQYPQLNYCDL